MNESFVRTSGKIAGCILAIFSAILLLMSCSPQQSDNAGNQSSSQYEEVNISLPEGKSPVIDFACIDGSLLIATKNDKDIELWKQNENGGDWDLLKTTHDSRQLLDQDDNFESAYIVNEGELIASALSENGKRARTFIFDGSDGVQEISSAFSNDVGAKDNNSVENGYADLRVSEDSTIIWLDQAGKLKKTNYETGETIAEYGEATSNGTVTDFVEYSDLVIVIYSVVSEKNISYSLNAYNSETGIRSDTISNYEKAFEAIISSHVNAEIARPVLSKTPDGLKLLCLVSGTLYAFNQEFADVLMNSAEESLLSPNDVAITLKYLNDASLLIQYYDGDNVNLKKIQPNDQSSVKTSLTLYTLHDNVEVRQAVSLYKTENPGVDIRIIVGIPNDGSIQAEEAIRNFNLLISSGNSPDLIVMDGLPVKKYQEQRMLLDLTDSLQGKLSSDKYFATATNAFAEDGLWGVPTRFSTPSLIAPDTFFAQATSLDQFTSALVNTREQEGTPLFSRNLSLAPLFDAYYPEFVTDQGSVDKDGLRSFFECIEAIAGDVKSAGSYEDLFTGFSNISEKAMRAGDVIPGYALAEIGYPLDVQALGMISLCLENAKTESSFAPLSFESGAVILPSSILSVSAASSNAEEAIRFIEFALSGEPQLSVQGTGMPINKDSFREVAMRADGGYSVRIDDSVVAERGAFTEDEVNKYVSLFDGIQICVIQDETLKEIIATELKNYLGGNITIDDAIGSVMQKADLYLAE